MLIREIQITNFKRFQNLTLILNPSFNLVVGNNGSGKTSALDALAVATGSWFLGIPDTESRHIRPDEIREVAHNYDGEIRFEKPGDAKVVCQGTVLGNQIEWTRSLKAGGRTTIKDAVQIKDLAGKAVKDVNAGLNVDLPLLSYYGTGRLWLEPRENSQVTDPKTLAKVARISRLDGYKNSIDPRLSVKDLVKWFAQQSWSAYRIGRDPEILHTVRKALLGSLDGAKDLYFDPNRGEILVDFEGQGPQPFANLSDGQRSLLALVGDLAQKSAKLNPHLGEEVLLQTSGVVLIDELDLHLHPNWQRRVVQDLRRTFPKIQFVATSHSPQIVGQVEAENLIVLDGDTAYGVESSFGLDSNSILRDIMHSTERDAGVKASVKDIEALILAKRWDDALAAVRAIDHKIGRTPELQRFYASIDRFRRLSA